MIASSFKLKHTLEERINIYQKKLIMHPNKILVIFTIQTNDNSSTLLCVVDPQQLVINFQIEFTSYFISKQKLNSSITFFLCVGNQIPKKDQTMQNIYNQWADKEDGFLYITAVPLETFGCIQQYYQHLIN